MGDCTETIDGRSRNRAEGDGKERAGWKGMGGEMWNTFLILVDKLDVDVTAPASCAWFV